MSLYNNREMIIRLIDRTSWKHSWHLPKDKTYGGVDWFSKETKEQVIKILIEDLDYLTSVVEDIKALLKAIR